MTFEEHDRKFTDLKNQFDYEIFAVREHACHILNLMTEHGIILSVLSPSVRRWIKREIKLAEMHRKNYRKILEEMEKCTKEDVID